MRRTCRIMYEGAGRVVMDAVIENPRDHVHFLRSGSVYVQPSKFRTCVYFKNLRPGAICAPPKDTPSNACKYLLGSNVLPLGGDDTFNIDHVSTSYFGAT